MKSLKIALIAFASLFATAQSFAAGVEPFTFVNFQAQMQNFSSVFGNSSNFNNGVFTMNSMSEDQTGLISNSSTANISGVIMPQQTFVDGNGGGSGHHNNNNPENVASNAQVVDVGVNANRSPGVASAFTNTHSVTNATSMGNMSATSFAEIFTNSAAMNFPTIVLPAAFQP